MLKKALHLLAVLVFALASAQLRAAEPVVSITPAPAEDFSCDLGAPGQFRMTGSAGNLISLAWDGVQGAADYCLEVRNSQNQSLILADTTPGLNISLAFVSPVAVTISVAARGPGCPASRRKSYLQDFLPIVVELIVEHTSPEGNLQIIEDPEGDNCYQITYPQEGNLYGFDLIYTTEMFALMSSYDIELSSEGTAFCESDMRIGKILPNPLNTILLGSQNGSWNAPPFCNPSQIVVRKFNGTAYVDWVYIKISYVSSNTASICFTVVPELKPKTGIVNDGKSKGSSTGIRFWSKDPWFSNAPDSRNAAPESTDLRAKTLVQNPFSDQLSIRSQDIPASAGPVRFQLFDLNGGLVLEQENSASQEYILPTSNLLSGMYLLRMDANGTSQTYRVVKLP